MKSLLSKLRSVAALALCSSAWPLVNAGTLDASAVVTDSVAPVSAEIVSLPATPAPASVETRRVASVESQVVAGWGESVALGQLDDFRGGADLVKNDMQLSATVANNSATHVIPGNNAIADGDSEYWIERADPERHHHQRAISVTVMKALHYGLVVAAVASAAASASTQAGTLALSGIGGHYAVQFTSLREARFKATLRQQYDFSCGSAALATLLTHHDDYPVTEQTVFEEMFARGDQEKIRREGFSLLDVKSYLKAHEFHG